MRIYKIKYSKGSGYLLWTNQITAFVNLINMIQIKIIIGTSITLSPLGIVSVCPGGQVALTCERTSGSFLYWTVSVPRLGNRTAAVADQGEITQLQFNGLHSTVFDISRASVNPLTSQMMINDVTTEINGSTIYCTSRDGIENGAPMVTINVTSKGNKE